MNKLTLAYTAGLFDGEGCIVIALYRKPYRGRVTPSYALVCNVNITNKPIIDWLRETYGGSIIEQTKYRPANYKRCWSWRVTSRKADKFLKAILPYLKLKKAQASLAIEFQKTRRNHGSIRKTQEETETSENFKRRISALCTRPRYHPI